MRLPSTTPAGDLSLSELGFNVCKGRHTRLNRCTRRIQVLQIEKVI